MIFIFSFLSIFVCTMHISIEYEWRLYKKSNGQTLFNVKSLINFNLENIF